MTDLLSERQLWFLTRVAAGQTMVAAGREIGLGAEASTDYGKRIRRKLDARSMPHAVRLGYQLGLLSLEPALSIPAELVEVLTLVADGRTNAEIGERLGRSEHRVADQVREVRHLLGARDRAHAAALAVALRIVRVQLPPPEYLAYVNAA